MSHNVTGHQLDLAGVVHAAHAGGVLGEPVRWPGDIRRLRDARVI